MPRPFDALREQLLKAGVAPRHVRRYGQELEEHLADLVALQQERGFDNDDAMIRARALLGSDDELAEAMIARREFRSLVSRAPWLVFGLAPPFVIVAAMMVLVGMTALASWPIRGLQETASTLDAASTLLGWYRLGADAVCGFANYGLGPIIVVLCLALALRQRLSAKWPVIGAVIIAAFAAATTLSIRLPIPHVPRSGAITVGIGLDIGPGSWPYVFRFALTAAVALACWLSIRLRDRKA